jgi:hypothetical protein
MGLIAIVSGTLSSDVSTLSSVGTGAGSIFVSVTLMFLLGYLDLFDAINPEETSQKTTLVATILPLAVTFVSIVLYQAMEVL